MMPRRAILAVLSVLLFAGGFGTSEAQSQEVLYLAEGTTRPGFDSVLVLRSSSKYTFGVEFLFADGSEPVRMSITLTHEVKTIRLNEVDGVGLNRDFGIVILGMPSDSGGLGASRVSTFTTDMGFERPVSGAIGSAPATSLTRELVFAEGSTLPGFREFITVLNPNSEPANIVVAYTYATGPGPTTAHTVAPRSRFTIDVNRPDEAGTGHEAVSARVVSSLAVAAERVLYFQRDVGTGDVIDGATTANATDPVSTSEVRDRAYPEGSVLDGFADFLLLFNPSREVVTANVQWALEDAPGRLVTVTVPAHSRMTIRTKTSPFGPGPVTSASGGVGARVIGPLVSERVTYVHRSIGGVLVDDAHAGNPDGHGGACSMHRVPQTPAGRAYVTLMGTWPDSYDFAIYIVAGHLIAKLTMPIADGVRKTIDISSYTATQAIGVFVSDDVMGTLLPAAAAVVIYPDVGPGQPAGSAILNTSSCAVPF